MRTPVDRGLPPGTSVARAKVPELEYPVALFFAEGFGHKLRRPMPAA
jgi:hypothetical protein